MKVDRRGDPAGPEAALGQALARQLRHWALRLGAADADAEWAAACARELSLAAGVGHVCATLEVLAPRVGAASVDALRGALLASRVVGAAPGAMPLLLDEGGRLYTHRSFEHERALAERLRRALAGCPAAEPISQVDEQQAAVERALRQRLTLISGGPGSGKTTTVVQLLARVLDAQPLARIALAAPTGKAAARMGEAIAERAAGLPSALQARMPREATTVHRLLGYHPAASGHGGFGHHAGHPLAIDWLIVDEASMLDLALARRLFDAVPEAAHIVLLGDAQQLAAVEAGAVFAELVGAAAGAGVAGAVVTLQRSHRFGADSTIGRLAGHLRRGEADAALALLAQPGSDLRWLPGLDMAAIEQAWLPYLDQLRRDPGDAAAAHRALARCRVLCATRQGSGGVLRINRQLDDWARAMLAPGGAGVWYPGRPLLITRNQPLLGLFNGDIGIVLAGDNGALAVHFAGRAAPVAPARLDEHESAWAMTVHKAQGSEADEVLLILPEPPSPVLTRELLYTAVTRARRQVTLLASAAALRAAAGTPTQRMSGLAARWAERGQQAG